MPLAICLCSWNLQMQRKRIPEKTWNASLKFVMMGKMLHSILNYTVNSVIPYERTTNTTNTQSTCTQHPVNGCAPSTIIIKNGKSFAFFLICVMQRDVTLRQIGMNLLLWKIERRRQLHERWFHEWRPIELAIYWKWNGFGNGKIYQ